MKCEICGITDQETRIIDSEKYGCLCRKHYLRIYKNKNPLRSVYDPNEFIIHESYAEIVLYDRYGFENGRAIIDVDDVDKCKRYKWHLVTRKNTSYAMSNGDKRVFLHRLIMNYDSYEMDVDHINRNGLDNRKSNLRLVSHGKNITNQGEGTGVRRVPSGNYQAIIMKNGKPIYLGTFYNYEDAYTARKQAEELYEIL